MPLRKKWYNPEDPRDAEELLNYLEDLNSDDEDHARMQESQALELVLLPPNDGADSDKDAIPSDEENVGSIRSIGKGVLREPMKIFSVDNRNIKKQLNLYSQKNVSDTEHKTSDRDSPEDNIPLAILFSKELKEKEIKKNIKKRQWETTSLQNTNQKLNLTVAPEPSFVKTIRDQNLNPIDIFKIFYDDEFMRFICNESQKYASYNGDHDFRVSPEELYKYFAILFLSGYCKIPNRRLYWETQGDTFNDLVSNSTSRNRFEIIHRYLHFNDNNCIDRNNRIYKIQPLIEHVNRISQNLFQPLGSCFSVDEAMKLYYGHSSMKQFIKGKPIRYGFKFWCLTTSEGYLLKFNPYCGAGEKLAGKPLGSSVCENLCLNYLPEGSTVYLDNYFNSLPLLHTLRGYNIHCIGTIRSDSIQKAPLRDLKKENRGSSHAVTHTANGITLIRWNDNNQVTIATNILDSKLCLSKGTCKRWSKKERVFTEVDQPSLVNLYNQRMGRVDIFDGQRGLYRIRIRSRKWYWPHVRFCLNGSIVNMWMLYRYVDRKLSLLDFIRRVVVSILTGPEYLHEPRPKTPKMVLNEVLFDKIDHIIDKIETQGRCGFCGKCPKFICVKCNIALHPDACFRKYHIK